jgi:hypothetical protein
VTATRAWWSREYPFRLDSAVKVKPAAFLLTISYLALNVKAAQGQAILPPDVGQFVDPNTKAIDLEKGDVNGDGRQDYLLVLERPEGSDEARYLLVLARQKNGRLKLAGRNNTILGCPTMQGEGGGIRVITTGNGFEVEDDFGSGMVGGFKRFEFAFKKKEGTWVLITIVDGSDDISHTPPEHIRHTEKPYKHGKVIRFDEFRGEDYSVGCNP